MKRSSSTSAMDPLSAGSLTGDPLSAGSFTGDPLSARSFTGDPADELPPYGAIPVTKHHHPSPALPRLALLRLPKALCLPAGHLWSCSSSLAFHIPPPFPTSHSQRLFLAETALRENSPQICGPYGCRFCSPALRPAHLPSLVTASRRAHQVGKAGNAPLNTSEVWGRRFQALVQGTKHPNSTACTLPLCDPAPAAPTGLETRGHLQEPPKAGPARLEGMRQRALGCPSHTAECAARSRGDGTVPFELLWARAPPESPAATAQPDLEHSDLPQHPAKQQIRGLSEVKTRPAEPGQGLGQGLAQVPTLPLFTHSRHLPAHQHPAVVIQFITKNSSGFCPWQFQSCWQQSRG